MQNSEEHLHLPVYYIINDMLKDRAKQPDEEIHRVAFGKVPGAGDSVPVELRGVASWHVHVNSNLGAP